MAEASNRSYSRPAFDKSITIQSEQAQRVFEREFPRVVSALYAIDVILRIIGDDLEADEVEGLVGSLIGECAQDIQNEKGRIDKLREDNGITALPRYSHPKSAEVRIVSPQVAQFVALLQKMDELMIALDALWLCGVLSNKQRSNGVYQWQQRLLRLGRRIVAIERRARASASKQGKDAEVRDATAVDITEKEGGESDVKSVEEESPSEEELG